MSGLNHLSGLQVSGVSGGVVIVEFLYQVEAEVFFIGDVNPVLIG